MKGYSVTLPVARFDRAPLASVMDEHSKVAITRLGNRVRAAGTAELGATDTEAPPERFGTARCARCASSSPTPASSTGRSTGRACGR